MKINRKTGSRFNRLVAIAACALLSVGNSVAAGWIPFDKSKLEEFSFKSQTCTGFYNTPSWKCDPITVPAYMARAKDSKALVFISHGSQGLDKRHSNYAQHLVAQGISAVVIGHWEARGLARVHMDYNAGRIRGGDSPNQTLDVLTLATELSHRPEWENTHFGFIGESMGGTTAINLTRPYLRRAYRDLHGRQPAAFTALVALYAGCTEYNTRESFAPIPLLFISGGDDDLTLASNCEVQVPWMNERGGKAELIVLPGQVHGFDAAHGWGRWDGENPAKCRNTRDGDEFLLHSNGKKYPGTPEGNTQMRRDCLRMTPPRSWAGNKGDPYTGYAEWTSFLQKHLLK